MKLLLLLASSVVLLALLPRHCTASSVNVKTDEAEDPTGARAADLQSQVDAWKIPTPQYDVAPPLKTGAAPHLKYFGWYRTHFTTADLEITGPHSNLYQAVDAGADTAALAAAKAAGQDTLLAIESLFPGLKTSKPDFKTKWEPAVPVLRELPEIQMVPIIFVGAVCAILGGAAVATVLKRVPEASSPDAAVMECGICYEVFEATGEKAPRILRCGHTFCHGCLVQMLHRAQMPAAGGKQGHKTVACAECRETTDVPRGKAEELTKNFAVIQLNA